MLFHLIQLNLMVIQKSNPMSNKPTTMMSTPFQVGLGGSVKKMLMKDAI
jgi:hypothetical protein